MGNLRVVSFSPASLPSLTSTIEGSVVLKVTPIAADPSNSTFLTATSVPFVMPST
nr:hypothetical protein [Butyrivibrio sp. VCD2006]